MNTLKKCILLMVLTLNLIPYMQDGKLKWTTTDAAAQLYYTEEILAPGYAWTCGETAHRYNAAYFFLSNDSCEFLTEKPGANTESEYAYTAKLTINENVNQYCHYENKVLLPNGKWCFFYTMAALTGEDACDYATWYFANKKSSLNIIGCEADVGVRYAHRFDMFSHCGVSLGSKITTAESLAANLNNGFGLVRISNSETHIDLLYGIEMNFAVPLLDRYVLKFDTNDGTGEFYTKVQLHNVGLPTDNWLVGH